MILGMSEVGEGPWAELPRGVGDRGTEPTVTVATLLLQNKKKEKK